MPNCPPFFNRIQEDWVRKKVNHVKLSEFFFLGTL